MQNLDWILHIYLNQSKRVTTCVNIPRCVPTEDNGIGLVVQHGCISISTVRGVTVLTVLAYVHVRRQTFAVSVGHVHHIVLPSVQKWQPGFTVQDGRQRVSWETHKHSQMCVCYTKSCDLYRVCLLSHRKTWTWPGCCRWDKSHPSCYWHKRLKLEDDGIPGWQQMHYLGVEFNTNELESKWTSLLYLFCDVEGFAVRPGVDP